MAALTKKASSMEFIELITASPSPPLNTTTASTTTQQESHLGGSQGQGWQSPPGGSHKHADGESTSSSSRWYLKETEYVHVPMGSILYEGFVSICLLGQETWNI